MSRNKCGIVVLLSVIGLLMSADLSPANAGSSKLAPSIGSSSGVIGGAPMLACCGLRNWWARRRARRCTPQVSKTSTAGGAIQKGEMDRVPDAPGGEGDEGARLPGERATPEEAAGGQGEEPAVELPPEEPAVELPPEEPVRKKPAPKKKRPAENAEPALPPAPVVDPST